MGEPSCRGRSKPQIAAIWRLDDRRRNDARAARCNTPNRDPPAADGDAVPLIGATGERCPPPRARAAAPPPAAPWAGKPAVRPPAVDEEAARLGQALRQEVPHLIVD